MRRREKNRKLLIRLDDWGEWVYRPVEGLGYGSQTLESVLMQFGGIYNDGLPQSRIPRYSPNPQCAEVQRIFQDLNEKWRKALLIRHALHLKDHEINNRNTGFTARHYYNLLAKAYPHIASKLGIAYEL